MYFVSRKHFVYSEIIQNETIIESSQKGFEEERRKGVVRPAINVHASYLSRFDVHEKTKAFDSLIDHVTKTINNLALERFKYKGEFICNQLWLIQYETHDFAVSHNHFPNAFVATFYLTGSYDPIVFENELYITPQKNELLIWEGCLNHAVPRVDGVRKVIAMNFSSTTA